MTCFWDGIFAFLTIEERRQFSINNPESLVRFFATHNQITNNCIWQGSLLPAKTLRENFDWVAHECQRLLTTPSKLYEGHDTSTCDPFLCLLVQLFHANITHNYNGCVLTYSYYGGAHRQVIFASNNGHFWIQG